jgi:hypothetical protein
VGRYYGPAVLIDHNGDAHAVHAMLRSITVGGLIRWRGALAGDAPWWVLAESRAPVTVASVTAKGR